MSTQGPLIIVQSHKLWRWCGHLVRRVFGWLGSGCSCSLRLVTPPSSTVELLVTLNETSVISKRRLPRLPRPSYLVGAHRAELNLTARTEHVLLCRLLGGRRVHRRADVLLLQVPVQAHLEGCVHSINLLVRLSTNCPVVMFHFSTDD